MTLDEQKEIVAKNICFYMADQMKSGRVKAMEAAKIMEFLVAGMEKATDTEQLMDLSSKVEQSWPELPKFNSGI